MKRGDWVRRPGLPGVYRVLEVRDNELLTYGGDKDPEGRRQFHSFLPSAVLPAAYPPAIRKHDINRGVFQE